MKPGYKWLLGWLAVQKLHVGQGKADARHLGVQCSNCCAIQRAVQCAVLLLRRT